MSNLGSRIKERRKMLKMTLDDLGGCVGVAKSTIAGYEKGFREPSINKMYLLALHLETTIDYLIGISEQANLLVDAKTLLHSKDLHWDGIPLNIDDLEMIRDAIEKSVFKRSLQEIQNKG